mgnify:CR=1 FL=1
MHSTPNDSYDPYDTRTDEEREDDEFREKYVEDEWYREDEDAVDNG